MQKANRIPITDGNRSAPQERSTGTKPGIGNVVDVGKSFPKSNSLPISANGKSSDKGGEKKDFLMQGQCPDFSNQNFQKGQGTRQDGLGKNHKGKCYNAGGLYAGEISVRVAF